MLKRQSLWVPLVKHNPTFLDGFRLFLRNNPISTFSVSAMKLRPEEIQVALTPDPRHAEKQVAALMAFPVLVTPEACDHIHEHHENSVSHSEIACGFATAVCDSYNSFHVMERLLPQLNPHVSVSIQSQCLRPLREGETGVVISTIDKMGKRLVYCKTEFFVEPDVITDDMIKREKKLRTVDELRAALMYYEKVVNGTHVKSILPEGKTK